MKADRIIAAIFVGMILQIFGLVFYFAKMPTLTFGFIFSATVCFISAIIIFFEQ